MGWHGLARSRIRYTLLANAVQRLLTAIPFLPAITALHAVPAQRFQTRCWRRRVWVGRPARCPPASSILAQGDLTAWLWMQCGSNRSPRGKFPSIREKNWEFCKFEGVAITYPRTNTRHFRRFSAKFPVRIEPGILLSNREFFLSNREISSAKTGNRRPSYARPFPTRGKGRLAAAVPGRNGNADSQITD